MPYPILAVKAMPVGFELNAVSNSSLQVGWLEVLKDNYFYFLNARSDPGRQDLVVIDPGDGVAARTFFNTYNFHPTKILLTHHHPDHIAGVELLRKEYGAKVYGYAENRALPPLDVELRDGDTVSVGSEKAQVLSVPGHCSGHIAFYFAESGDLFSGDVVFNFGCGRIFSDGSPAELYESFQKIAALPAKTRIWPGHEYALNNGPFAAATFPNNEAIARELEVARELRSQGQACVPTTLEREQQINPFFLARSLDEFKKYRQAKDEW